MLKYFPQPAKNLIKHGLLSPAGYPLRRYYRGCATILCYHRITSQVFHPDQLNSTIWLQVDREDFAYQLRTLKKSLPCLSLGQAFEGLRRNALSTHSVVLTFDDGYKDNLTLALPLLERFSIPATIFITTGFINRTTAPWWDEHRFIAERTSHLSLQHRGENIELQLRNVEEKGAACYRLRSLFKESNAQEQSELLKQLRAQCVEKFNYDDLILNWDEVIALSKHPLISIGCHTATHPVLSNLSYEEVLSELRQSKEELEQRIGKRVPHLAYPIGGPEEANEREFKAAEAVGFECAVTTRIGHWQHDHSNFPFILPRITIDYFDTDFSFNWKISGMHSMAANRGKNFVTS